jgi:Outer membrane protein beta-barrel domain
MQQSEFEKKVQQKMGELKLSPTAAVWTKLAAGLPAEKKPRHWVFFMLLFAGLLTASLLLWNKYNTGAKKMVENDIAAKENGLQNNISQKNEENKKPVADGVIANQNNNDGIKTAAGTSRNNKTPAAVKIKQGWQAAVNNTPGINSIATNAKILKTKTTVKIKTKAPVAVDDDRQEFIAAPMENSVTANAKTVVRVGAPVAAVNDNLIEAAKNSAGGSAVITNKDIAINKDTAITTIIKNNTDDSAVIANKDIAINKDTAIATATNTSKNKKNHSRWQYGLRVAAGSGILKKDLFGSTPVFTADSWAFNTINNSVSNPVPTYVQVISTPNNPASGLAINWGLYAQKNITARCKLSAGLNYAYQANIIKVGNRVDSVATFNYAVNKNLAADNFYRIGDGIKYKNKFHLLQVPLLFEWALLKKLPVYFEGGTTMGYLVSSNALVYNGSSNTYFTDAIVFNKLLVCFNAGAGINVAQKTKLPFSIGYQFGYTTSSATKTVFGKQRFVTSLLYVKIPFKK